MPAECELESHHEMVHPISTHIHERGIYSVIDPLLNIFGLPVQVIGRLDVELEIFVATTGGN